MGWADSYIERLNAGETVSFRPRGNSMEPYIRSGQLVTVEPRQVYAVGEIVLCSMGSRQYLHFITSVLLGGEIRYQIGNARGRVNGWTNKIYGAVVRG